MMKKIYEAPVMEMTKFFSESVITVSGGAIVGKGGMGSGLINGNEGKNAIDF